jgi:hypothetical protein
MREDLIQKPITPSIHLNEIDEDSDMLFEPDENDMCIVHLNDVHQEEINNNINDVYINASDITIVHIIKENFDGGTDFKEMMRPIFGNDIPFLNPKNFIQK